MKTASMMDWVIYILYGVNIGYALLNFHFSSLCGWLLATYWYWSYRNVFKCVDTWLKKREADY